MTIALCLVCGSKKFGAFNPCDDCLWMPYSDQDRARSVMVSDHFVPEPRLEEWGRAIHEGTELQLPEEVVASNVKQMRSLSMKLTSLPPRPTGLGRWQEACDTLWSRVETLASLKHSRGRYLQKLRSPGKTSVDDVQLEALRVLGPLSKEDIPACVPIYLVLARLPYMPMAAAFAFTALGNGPPGNSPEAACQRIGSLHPGDIQTVAAAARALLREIKGEYLERLCRLLSPLLGPEPPCEDTVGA